MTGIRRESRSRKKPYEESDEVIVLWIVETTKLGRREGPLLQRCIARR
jgi:hypothetical protein